MTTSGASSSSVLLALLITMTLLREVHVPERALISPAAVQALKGGGGLPTGAALLPLLAGAAPLLLGLVGVFCHDVRAEILAAERQAKKAHAE